MPKHKTLHNWLYRATFKGILGWVLLLFHEQNTCQAKSKMMVSFSEMSVKIGDILRGV